MKFKNIGVLLLMGLPSKEILSQINFEKVTYESELYQRVLKADSAIKAGEFGTTHSLLIIKNGLLVFEAYYNGWRRDSIHQLQSATKSLVSTLMGCAIKNNFIRDEHEYISVYYPDSFFTDNSKRKIRISDLLTQQHGLKWSEAPWESPDNTWRKVMSSRGNWYKLILQTPMDTVPGKVFNYSNAAPVLVTGLIQYASRMNIDAFAKKYLFDPLDITKYSFWQGNEGPQNNGMALVSLTSRDMAKIGQLYLQKGKWKGNTILPESYFQSAISPIVKNVGLNGFYKGYDYGYFWWSNPVSMNDKKSPILLARGAGGQNIAIIRNENMVVVITAWNMQQPNKLQTIIDKYLLK